MGKHINTNKTASRIGVRPQTVRVWRCRGRGPKYIRLGGPRGRCLYDTDEIDRWLAERTFSNTTEETVASAEEDATE